MIIEVLRKYFVSYSWLCQNTRGLETRKFENLNGALPPKLYATIGKFKVVPTSIAARTVMIIGEKVRINFFFLPFFVT